MGKRVLFLGYVWPESHSSAAGVRSLDLAHAFLGMGAELCVASHAKKSEFSDELASLGIRELATELNRTSFDEAVAEFAPDYVVFDRFVTEEQYGARVERAAPKAMRIFDTIDLHALRRARAALVKAGKSAEEVLRAGESMETSEDFLREASCIYRSDLTLILSDFETALLEKRYGIPASLLHYYPFSYEAPPAVPSFADRSHFVFLGNFRHEPNHDSVFYTVRAIWPSIRARLPGAELHIFGAYPPKEVSALHNPGAGVHFFGRAEDAVTTFQKYRVNLAVLRFGAGIKGKIADGWMAGTPAITTPVGAEGMRAPPGIGTDWGGWIGVNPSELAFQAVALHEDAHAWKRAQAVGRAILAAKFSREANHRAFHARLEEISGALEAKRNENLVGAMLRMNQHRATDYFSRWIELKEDRAAQTAAESCKK